MAKPRAVVEFDFLGSLGKPDACLDGSGLPVHTSSVACLQIAPSHGLNLDQDQFRFGDRMFFGSDRPQNGKNQFVKASAALSSASPPQTPIPLVELNAGSGSEVKAQLTIFYDGKVNVYENVPADRAYAIMLLAGRGAVEAAPPHLNNSNSNISNLNNNSTNINNLNNTNNINNNNTIHSAKAAPPAALPHQSSVVKNVVNVNSDLVVPPSVSADPNANPMVEITPSNKKSQCELPRARKASLARFLEKRKERILTKTTSTGLGEDDISMGAEMPEKSSLKRPLSRASSPSPSRAPRPTVAWEQQ